MIHGCFTVPAVRWRSRWQCLPEGRSRSPWLSAPSAGSQIRSLGLQAQLLTHTHTHTHICINCYGWTACESGSRHTASKKKKYFNMMHNVAKSVWTPSTLNSCAFQCISLHHTAFMLQSSGLPPAVGCWLQGFAPLEPQKHSWALLCCVVQSQCSSTQRWWTG